MFKHSIFFAANIFFCGASLFADWSGSIFSGQDSSMLNQIADSSESSAVVQDENSSDSPSEDFERHKIALRHIESNGIGYDMGYTTLEGMFSFTPQSSCWVPFVDVRGHLFNDGRPAVNAGTGLRRRYEERVLGAYGYYDYRKTRRYHYNQVSIGLESLGNFFDARINGYLPFGKKESSYYGVEFDHFSGNSMWLERKREYAFASVFGELGFRLLNKKYAGVYFSAGPYYLHGKQHHSFGMQGHLDLSISKYLTLGAVSSYDSIFNWTVQGVAKLQIAFGPKSKAKAKKECSSSPYIAYQSVRRSEIIPVDKERSQVVATDPATGQPLVFIFVSNLSNSRGTFESPYSTLLAAQNASTGDEVIYVFPGDGTSTGLNSGFVMKSGQMLWGASIDHTIDTSLGQVTVPALSSVRPILTNTTPGAVITLASNTEVSGFTINPQISQSALVLGSAISNVQVQNNSISVTSGFGLYFNNVVTGTATVTGNQFVAQDASTINVGVNIESDTGAFIISSNSFAGVNNSAGFELGISTVSNNSVVANLNLSANNNTFSLLANTTGIPRAINMSYSNVAGSTATVRASSNRITIGGAANSDSAFTLSCPADTFLNTTISGNTFTQVAPLSVPDVILINTGAKENLQINLSNPGIFLSIPNNPVEFQ